MPMIENTASAVFNLTRWGSHFPCRDSCVSPVFTEDAHMKYFVSIAIILLSTGTALSGAKHCLDIGHGLFKTRHAQLAALASH